MSERSHDPVERLRRRDEMLQILFWLAGEGFEREMTPEGVARFLGWSPTEVAAELEVLVEQGFASGPDDAGRYALSQAGRSEGGRRFVEDFAPILSRTTHHGGECHDPDCGCHDSPFGAAACTAGADVQGPRPRRGGDA